MAIIIIIDQKHSMQSEKMTNSSMNLPIYQESVINETLGFIRNKTETSPMHIVIHLCSSFYDRTTENCTKPLHDLSPNQSLRFIKRQQTRYVHQGHQQIPG